MSPRLRALPTALVSACLLNAIGRGRVVARAVQQDDQGQRGLTIPTRRFVHAVRQGAPLAGALQLGVLHATPRVASDRGQQQEPGAEVEVLGTHAIDCRQAWGIGHGRMLRDLSLRSNDRWPRASTSVARPAARALMLVRPSLLLLSLVVALACTVTAPTVTEPAPSPSMTPDPADEPAPMQPNPAGLLWSSLPSGESGTDARVGVAFVDTLGNPGSDALRALSRERRESSRGGWRSNDKFAC